MNQVNGLIHMPFADKEIDVGVGRWMPAEPKVLVVFGRVFVVKKVAHHGQAAVEMNEPAFGGLSVRRVS